MSVVVNYAATAESEAALGMAEEEAVRHRVPLHVLSASADATADLRERPATGGMTRHLHEAPEHQSMADAILDLAVEVDADLIVVGTRQRSPAGKLFLGSTAQEILLAADTPVLLVKP